ncbi:MAG: hypothetical protein U0031_11400 [Thermomicrobiales bacterium]
MRALRKNQRAAYLAFNTAVAEIRIGLPESETPPFGIPLTLLLEGDEASAETANAITLVEANLREALDPARASLVGVLPSTKSRMSVETYFRTALVELDYLTYDGEESLGAEPVQNP